MDNTGTLHGLYCRSCVIHITYSLFFNMGVGLYVLLSYQVWGYFWTGKY